MRATVSGKGLMCNLIPVLHLRATGFVGGPEKQLLRHAGHATAHGFQVLVGSFLQGSEGTALLEEAKRLGLGTMSWRCRGPVDLSPARAIASAVAAGDIALICAHDAKSSLLGLLAARRAGVPFIAWSRGWTGETRRVRLYDRVHKWLLRRADLVVAVSQAQAARCRAIGVRAERLRVVPNAVDLDGAPAAADLRRELGLPPACRIVLSVGRLSREKGHRDLVAAARSVCEEHADVVFVLVGEGAERPRLEAQIRALGLAKEVMLCGFRRDAAALMRQADVLALPSFTEGLPNVILEAFAAGLPVVATDAGGVSELVRPETGWLVRDRALFGGVLAVALRDQEEARRRAHAAQELVAREFSFAKQAEAIAALYREVLAVRAEMRPARSGSTP